MVNFYVLFAKLSDRLLLTQSYVAVFNRREYSGWDMVVVCCELLEDYVLWSLLIQSMFYSVSEQFACFLSDRH
jgi:hypothetical protein